MREILFRGKRKDNGEWVYGYLFVMAKGSEYESTYILGDLDEYESIYEVWKCANEVIPYTVVQYIGRRDCGGNKLFERDVVTAKFKSNGSRHNFKIININGEFLFDNGSVAVRFDQIRSAVKIGNIIDNPDWKELRI